MKMDIESPEKDIKKVNQEDEGVPLKCLKKTCGGILRGKTLTLDEVRLDGLRRANAQASAEALKMASIYKEGNAPKMVLVDDPDGKRGAERVPESVLNSLEEKANQALEGL
jgi:hypothetical protein